MQIIYDFVAKASLANLLLLYFSFVVIVPQSCSDLTLDAGAIFKIGLVKIGCDGDSIVWTAYLSLLHPCG